MPTAAAPLLTLLGILTALAGAAAARAEGELLYGTEGNRLRRFDVDTIGNPKLLDDVFIEAASGGEMGGPGGTEGGRDVNGMICRFPDGTGRFVLGEDTGQPDTRPGWGVFTEDAVQVGKLATTYRAEPADDRVGEPFGCAFDSQGNLYTTSIGIAALANDATGQLIKWFPPFEHFPGAPGSYPNGEISTNFCKIDVDIATATSVMVDANDNVYVAAPAGFQVLRFAPPFPTGPDAAGGCGRVDPTGQPLADVDRANRSVFIQAGFLQTFTGLALAPNGNLYAGRVLPGRIDEYDFDGNLVRNIVAPDGAPTESNGTPQGLAVGGDGTLYYADLDIGGNLQPGDDGKFWRVRFDAKNNPLAPEPILTGLAFPDGVAIFPGDFQVDPAKEWRTYAGGPERRFYNPDESILTPKNIGLIRERWRFGTDAIVTGSPAVATVHLDGEGPTQVVYFQSWDNRIYAVRLEDGSEVWRFEAIPQPCAGFPNAASVHVEGVDVPGIGLRDVVLIGAGETLYALDAADGAEYWSFQVGTGRVPANPHPNPVIRNPQCLAEGERNEIESSVYAAGGLAFFGMDVNDEAVGKGGFYAVDLQTGYLAWFFDLESGKSCVAQAGDDITAFDPYHSEAELGLPAGFRSRPGCDFPFSQNGCGNVWSSPALDLGREALFVASSNCDTDDDPTTNVPPPPMPPYDEAIFSLDMHTGAPRWVWRPREVDNADLAFGAVPNLFTIDVDGSAVDVVGVGNKDGTYYVVDRDGVNQSSGVAWDDADPSLLPYWWTNVVAGGSLGGVIATAAVDVERRRVFFSTAPGDTNEEVGDPQLPTMHALDMDTGAVVWDNGTVSGPDASFSPTSAVPGLAFTGSVLSSRLRAFDTEQDAGTLVLSKKIFVSPLGFGDAIASGAVVVNGTLLIGEGVGFRGLNSTAEAVSKIPSPLIALCVPGQPGCDIPSWVLSDLNDDGVVDEADLDLFSAALGSSRGDAAFNDLADLDRDGTVTFADYQLWLEGQRGYDLSVALAAVACGLLGVEPFALLAVVAGVRRLRRRRSGVVEEPC